MDMLKKIWNRKFYGKPIHIAGIIIGSAVLAKSIYWIGRSDEINQILDIVQENGSITLGFWSKDGKKVNIHMSTD